MQRGALGFVLGFLYADRACKGSVPRKMRKASGEKFQLNCELFLTFLIHRIFHGQIHSTDRQAL